MLQEVPLHSILALLIILLLISFHYFISIFCIARATTPVKLLVNGLISTVCPLRWVCVPLLWLIVSEMLHHTVMIICE